MKGTVQKETKLHRNHKFQVLNHKQIRFKTVRDPTLRVLELGFWDLEFVWNLGFRILNFRLPVFPEAG